MKKLLLGIMAFSVMSLSAIAQDEAEKKTKAMSLQ
jgi:hypothetical protein